MVPSRTRYQLDALVEVLESGPDRIVTREEFERTFGESDSSSGWQSFDGFETRNIFDAAGNLVSRSAVRSDEIGLLKEAFLRPILDLRVSPPAFVPVGSTWIRAYDVVDEPEESASVRDTFVLGGISPCAYGPKCIHVHTLDQDRDASPSWSTRTRIAEGQRDVVIDTDGRTLSSGGVWKSETTWEPSSLGFHSTQAEKEVWFTRIATSIRLVTAPSLRPRGMSERIGTVALSANPWAEIWIDGKHPSEDVMQTPFRRTLPVGPHVIRLANPYMGHDETIKVIIEPARVTSIKRDFCVDARAHGPGCYP